MMVFRKGFQNTQTFYANGSTLEEVQEFVYLGIALTPHLAYSKHVDKLSKIRHIFSQTYIINLSLHLALKSLDIYINKSMITGHLFGPPEFLKSPKGT